MSRVALPSGAWLVLGPTSGVRERDRRPVRLAFARISAEGRDALSTGDGQRIAAMSAADQEVMLDINDLVAAALTVEASWLQPGQRCTVDDLVDLPGRDYDAVVEAVGPLIGPFVAAVDFDPTPDPSSPTPPSSV